MKQQDIASSIQPQQLPVTAEATAVSVAQKDISKMTWREGKKAPERIQRGAAVVDGNTAYFKPGKVYGRLSEKTETKEKEARCLTSSHIPGII